MGHEASRIIILAEVPGSDYVSSQPSTKSAPGLAYHDRQYLAKVSSSLGATPNGVVDRLRPLGGGVGLAFLGVLERPGKEGEVGEINRPLGLGLVGGDMEGVEGRS